MVLSPLLFRKKNKKVQIVHKERFAEIVTKFWTSLGQWKKIDCEKQEFQPDEAAPPYTSNNSLTWLRERFQEWLISRKSKIGWVTYTGF